MPLLRECVLLRPTALYSRSDLPAAFSTFTSENFKLAPLQGDVHAMRHLSIPEQGRYLRLVLNYYHLLSTGCAAYGGEASDIG